MKKILALLLITAVAISMIACSDNSLAEESKETQAAEKEEQENSDDLAEKAEEEKHQDDEEKPTTNPDNFFLNPKIIERPVTNAVGEQIGTRAYIETSKILFFDELEGSEEIGGYIKELFETELNAKKYNWFNINFEDGSTLFFAGANYTIMEYHENQNDDGAAIEEAIATYFFKNGAYEKVE